MWKRNRQNMTTSGQMSTGSKVGASRRIVEETRRLYGMILTKPLDEKQLFRPSFKFIQEIVKSLMIETKLLRDVFNANHFGSSAAVDRRAKIEFIQKLIDFVANNRQAVANCLAAKVVAGLEPNKTNELLQSLARIAQQKLGAHDERRPRTFTRQTSGGGSRPSSTATATKTTSATRNSIDTTTSEQRIEAPNTSVQSLLPVNVQSDSGGTPQDARVSAGQATKVQGEQKRKSSGNINYVTNTATISGDKQHQRKNSVQLPVATSTTTIESDIARGTQFVRGNLKSLKETFVTICKVEDSLRASLILATRDNIATS